jgi:hypothetical protein
MTDPTFLICSERSGSNLIRAMLDAHSQVYAPMPLNLGRDFWYRVYRYGDLSDDGNWDALLRDVVQRLQSYPSDLGIELSEDELRENLSDRSFAKIYEYVYTKGMRAAGKSQMFLKENYVGRHIGLFRDGFPDARFVYQVRDPRDYVLSCRKVARIDHHYTSVGRVVGVWKDDQEAALNVLFTLGPSRVFAQRYEDLVSDPERVLRALCEFLDIPFEESMLRYYERKTAKLAAESSPEFWQNLSKPVMSDNVSKYRDGLSRIELGETEHRLRDLMERLGYRPETSKAGTLGRLSILLYELYDRVASTLKVMVRRRKVGGDSGAGRTPPRVGVATPRGDVRYSYVGDG